MTTKPGPIPRATQVPCATCPRQLSRSDLSHGNKRCTVCRQAAPRPATYPRPTPGRRAPVPPVPAPSFWVGASREDLSKAIAAREAERRRGSAPMAYPIGSGGLP